MTSAVFILPAPYRAAGDDLGEAMGWGPGSYSVPLSATGVPPATHYGCRADVTEGFMAVFADPPPAAAPVLAVLLADLRDGGGGFEHWSDVLAAQGLSVVHEPEVLE